MIFSRPLNPLLPRQAFVESDAFLSFCGGDTREEFTVPLYHALCQRNINTYIDDVGVPRGDDIAKALFEAIEKSRISIVVLSPGYASSKWCLDELVKIHDCVKRNGQLVYPIFHGIELSEARDPINGCYAQAMAEYEEKFKKNKAKVLRWMIALFDVANLDGPHFTKGCDTEHFIEGIVEEISQRLRCGPLGQLSRQLEPHTKSDTGSRDDFHKLVGRKAIGQIDVNWNKGYLGSPKDAQRKFLHPSSCQKGPELQKNEGFVMVLPSMMGASTSKDRHHELPGPGMSVVQCNVLSNVQNPEEIGMKKVNSILKGAEFNVEATAQPKGTWAEETFAKLVGSMANLGLASKQFEGGLKYIELNGKHFGSTLNGTSMEAFFVSPGAETNPLSLFQDAGNGSIRIHQKTKCAMQLLKIFVSKRFCELLHPAGSRFIEDMLNNVLNISEDYRISVRMSSVLRKLLNSFIQWIKDYENANIKFKSTTAELSKVSDLEERLATTNKESKKAVSFENELCSQLACLMEEKRQLEEQLMAVNAQITELTSSKSAAAERKRSLLVKGRVLKAKMDDSMIRVPRLRAEQKAAMLTKANIEAEWSKLAELYTNIFMLEFGSS